MTYDLPKGIDREVRAIPDQTTHAEAVELVTEIVVRHGYDLAKVERCFVEASLAFSLDFQPKDRWLCGWYRRGAFESMVWGMAVKGLRERAEESAGDATNFEAMAEEFITFVPDEIAESGNGALMIGALLGEEPLGDNQPWELLTLRPDQGLAKKCSISLRRRLVKLLRTVATAAAQARGQDVRGTGGEP